MLSSIDGSTASTAQRSTSKASLPAAPKANEARADNCTSRSIDGTIYVPGTYVYTCMSYAGCFYLDHSRVSIIYISSVFYLFMFCLLLVALVSVWLRRICSLCM